MIVEYYLYKHRTLSNKWKVVYKHHLPEDHEGAPRLDDYFALYDVVHNNDKVTYTPINNK
ncbi:MAG: hypothetical protein CL840_15255 [Crocinitomicaceae bacterium]|jgi:hypothetical protein|nr:hypothetical protein [Crocinitomicaceae bacterium]